MALGAANGGGEHFPPGVRLGNGDGERHGKLAQHADGLRSTRHDGDAAERVGESLGRIARGEGLIQNARADAGEQNDHVELAGEQTRGELEGLFIALDGGFAHGRGHDRLALLFADELRDFGRAPAFERDHFQAGK